MQEQRSQESGTEQSRSTLSPQAPTPSEARMPSDAPTHSDAPTPSDARTHSDAPTHSDARRPQWSLNRKFGMVLALILLFMSVRSAIALNALGAIRQDYGKLSGDVIEQSQALARVKFMTAKFMSKTREYMLFEEAATLEELVTLRVALDTAFAEYASPLSSGEPISTGAPSPSSTDTFVSQQLRELIESLKEQSAHIVSLVEGAETGAEVDAYAVVQANEELNWLEIRLDTAFNDAEDLMAGLIQDSSAAVEKRLGTLRTAMLVGSLLSVGLYVMLFVGLRAMVVRPLRRFNEVVQRVIAGDLSQTVDLLNRDEIGELAAGFNAMTAQLGQTFHDLEAQSMSAQRRSVQLEAAAQIAREASAILDLELLLDETVRLIANRFGFYHVGLYLLDEEGTYVTLQAASSDAGRNLAAEGYQCRVGREGNVGFAVARGTMRIIPDVSDDALFRALPELADTRSQAVLPLSVRGDVIGALDVQSDTPDAFDEEQLEVLQTLTAQVAVAIRNIRLSQEAQESLDVLQRAYGDMSSGAWHAFLQRQPRLGYRYDGQDVYPVTPEAGADAVRKVDRGRPVRKADAFPGAESNVAEGADEVGALPALTIPLEVSGNVIGRIHARKSDAEKAWSEQESAMMARLADQLGQTIENARLFQTAQRREARERLVGRVSSRIRETLDIDAVLQTTVQEMRDILGLAEAEVRIGLENVQHTAPDNKDSETVQ